MKTNRILMSAAILTLVCLTGCSTEIYDDVSPVTEAASTERESDGETIVEDQNKTVWDMDAAKRYQKELSDRMAELSVEDRKIETDFSYDFDLEQLKKLLTLLNLDVPEGYTKELPEVSEEDIKQYAKYYNNSFVTEPRTGDYEPTEKIAKLFRAMYSPDAYIKCVAEDGRFENYYFKDVYYSILHYEPVSQIADFEVPEDICIGYWDRPLSIDEKYRCPLFEMKDDPIDEWDKYILVNCRTGEETEYVPESGTSREEVFSNLKQMFNQAKETALEPNREYRQKMVYESIKSIMELIGTDLDTAKRIYEDLCWVTWTDICSVDKYISGVKSLLFTDVNGNKYTGYLNDSFTLWRVVDQDGTVLYEAEPAVSRPYSLACFTNYDCETKIMELVGTDMENARKIYEGINKMGSTPIRAAVSFDPEIRALTYRSDFGGKYIAILDDENNVLRITTQEIIDEYGLDKEVIVEIQY